MRHLSASFALALLSSSVAAQAQGNPLAVEAAAQSPTTVKVFWNPVPRADLYLIYRGDEEIATVQPPAKEFVDTKASPGTSYRYNVIAKSGRSLQRGRPYLERTFDVLPDSTDCDLLVIGANSAGTSAAVTASRYGLKVVLIESTKRLGGMAVNGLGASDIRKLEHASGFFDEFRSRVADIYGTETGRFYEPRIAMQAMKEIIWTAPGLVVHRQVRPTGVRVEGGQIKEVSAEYIPTGRKVRFQPRMVIDATECGDVAAWAGAPFRMGREPKSAREKHAGVLYYDRATDSAMPGSTGKGDKRLQAYAYLMIVKDFGKGADKTIPKPPGYDRKKYAGSPKWAASWAVTSGKLPNDKYEVNQHPHGGDLQEANYRYPTASYTERAEIEKRYKEHALGYLYWLQTEGGAKHIGLSEDDYRDTDGWPTLLYIREARRFEADHMMDETDIVEARTIARSNSIAIADYAMDSHATQVAPDFDHYSKGAKHMGEGEFYIPQYTPWHQVPFHIMIPRRVDNVFTPTAVSATHVAYGTYRMEPVRMQFGAAAALASMFCLKYNLTPRTVPVGIIQEELMKSIGGSATRLAKDGIGGAGASDKPAFLYLIPDVKSTDLYFSSIHWLASRGFFPCPPPTTKGSSAGLTSQPFEPTNSLSRAEAQRLLNHLASRVAGTSYAPDHPAKPGSSGRQLDVIAPFANPAQTREAPLTRGQSATLLAQFMKWTAPAGQSSYSDVVAGSEEGRAIEALYTNYLRAHYWDTNEALALPGKPRFQPEKTMTRALFAEWIYLAHRHLGPLFFDHPADAR